MFLSSLSWLEVELVSNFIENCLLDHGNNRLRVRFTSLKILWGVFEEFHYNLFFFPKLRFFVLFELKVFPAHYQKIDHS